VFRDWAEEAAHSETVRTIDSPLTKDATSRTGETAHRPLRSRSLVARAASISCLAGP
jgi:hypothetical protein